MTERNDAARGWLDHLGIVTQDMSGALKFYAGILGFRLLKQWRSEDGKTEFAMLDSAGGRIELLCFAGTLGVASHAETNLRQPGLRHFAVAVDDVDTFRTRLEEAGIPILIQPRAGTYFKRYLFCQAPDGVFVELVEE